MNFRRTIWGWLCAAACVNAAIGLADDSPVDAQETQAAPQKPAAAAEEGVKLNVRFQSSDGQTGAVDVLGYAADGSGEQPADVLKQVLVANPPVGTVRFLVDSENQGKYWIGLMCVLPPEALRTQLDLAADTGLLVEEIHDGSPAAKAGMQRFDLLLSATFKGQAEPKRLSSLADLISSVQSAETGPLKLEFLRRGRKQTLELIPEERPAPADRHTRLDVVETSAGVPVPPMNVLGLRWAGPMIVSFPPALPEGMTIEFVPAEGSPEKVIVRQRDQKWEADVKSLDKLPEEIAAHVQPQVAARVASNGRSFTGQSARAAHVIYGSAGVLPDNTTVTVVRKGAEPAKITIQKGDKSWEATEKDLSKLPDEIRPLAETALTGPGMHRAVVTKQVPLYETPNIRYRAVPSVGVPAIPAMPATRAQAPQDIDRQLKELSEQVEKLRQAVESTRPRK